MSYKIINTFNDLEHNTLYKKGDLYPKEGFDLNPERVKELQATHPKYKRAFLATEEVESHKENGQEPVDPEKVELDIGSLSKEQLKEEVHVPQLKEYLDDKGIEYKSSAKKDELIDLIKKEE